MAEKISLSQKTTERLIFAVPFIVYKINIKFARCPAR